MPHSDDEGLPEWQALPPTHPSKFFNPPPTEQGPELADDPPRESPERARSRADSDADADDEVEGVGTAGGGASAGAGEGVTGTI